MTTRLSKGLLASILILLLNVIFVGPVFSAAQEQDRVESRSNYAPSKIRLSAGGGTGGRGIFYIDELFPLFYSKDRNTLWFINPKQNWQTPNAQEYNLGTGLRHIFNDKFILGLHYFYDKKLSPNNIWHNQNGLGAEFLSEPFDARFNYYLPLHPGKGALVENYYKLGSTNLLNIGRREEALRGYDFEFGCPVFAKQTKTRLYLGGFFFQSKLAKDVNGFRVGTETDITKWFAFDTNFNHWTNGETEVLADLRVTIPFEFGRVIEKKNPFKASELDYIHDRLFERVVRDIDVKTNTTKIGDVETPVPGKGIIYVDTNAPAGTGNGTLENSYTTTAEALADSRLASGISIYVFDKGAPYPGGIVLPDGIIFWGSGTNLGYIGIPVTTNPVISGGANVITLGNSNTVAGFDITGGGWGIYAMDVTSNTILNNNIYGNSGGIYIGASGTNNVSNFNISRNFIYGNTSLGGVYIQNNSVGIGGSTMSGFTISNNNISDNPNNAIYLDNYDSFISDFTFSNNTFLRNGGCGLALVNNSFVSVSTLSGTTISGNRISDSPFNYGLAFITQSLGGAASTSGITVSNNILTGNALSGTYFYNNGTMSDFTFTHNVMSGNTGNGVYFEFVGTSNYSGINFGNASDGTGGYNSIYSNGVSDILNNSGVDNLLTENNYWGGGPGVFSGSNSVDGDPLLITNPN